MNYIFGILAVIITIMFFLSGIDKFRDIQGTSKRLAKKLNTTTSTFFDVVIVLVGILEVVAPILIVIYAFTGKIRILALISGIALAVFTFAATAIYYFPPQGKKYYPFMSNLTTFGALLLISYLTYTEKA